MKISLKFILTVMVVSLTAHAEIEKIAIPAETGLKFYWWPKLTAIDGWHQEKDFSYFYSANSLAPDGFTFENVETVMYARSIYKPREPNIKSLDQLIENDKKDFELNVAGVLIKEIEAISTSDGQKLKSYTYFPTKTGNWEQVSYGEEGDFYLIFTISSRSQSGFLASVSAYEKLITSYKK
jgi:hypothetical protein